MQSLDDDDNVKDLPVNDDNEVSDDGDNDGDGVLNDCEPTRDGEMIGDGLYLTLQKFQIHHLLDEVC
ncbi:hypothetical protein RclHR1_00110025 [Rhizophagus clarus]|uniref:Uncharacterized protein n=1 Tax=Rhizophagus clarus TaxID=94130 RepID=A0A2Z6Q7P5_9GLOM|nr:hypothetical protein RclHR1_00110025 [Rhizophagus clarus]